VDPRLPRGIGLGLPIARRLVEAQGGRIAIDTPPSGRGTAFIITLPFATEVHEEEAAPVAVES
jgi:signal transduction histidine kinase